MVQESTERTEYEGEVTSGAGDGQYFVSLDGYARQFNEKLGYDPYPGTLNVDLGGDVPAFEPASGVEITAWKDDDRTYGAATCYPVQIAGVAGHVVIPDRTHHDETTLEIIAAVCLRDELELADGDRVDVILD